MPKSPVNRTTTSRPKTGPSLSGLTRRIGALELEQRDLIEEFAQLRTANEAVLDELRSSREVVEALSNEIHGLLNARGAQQPTRGEHGSGALRSRLPQIADAHSTPINANARTELGVPRRR